jgi:hypothetical protein
VRGKLGSDEIKLNLYVANDRGVADADTVSRAWILATRDSPNINNVNKDARVLRHLNSIARTIWNAQYLRKPDDDTVVICTEMRVFAGDCILAQRQ